MSTHTGEYPYKCIKCNIGYHCKWKFVEEHTKKHHPETYVLYKSGELEVPCFDESKKIKKPALESPTLKNLNTNNINLEF